MKRILPILCCLITSFFCAAQTMQPLENISSSSDQVSNVIIRGSTIYYMLNLAQSDTNNYIIQAENYFVRLDVGTNQRFYRKIYIDTPNIVNHGFQLEFKNNKFYTIMKTYADTVLPNFNGNLLYDYTILTLDSALNTVDMKKIEPGHKFYNPVFFDFVSDTMLNLSLTTSAAGFPQNALLNVNTGDTTSLKTLAFGPAKSWSLLPDSTWILSHFGSNWTTYDKNFQYPDTLKIKPKLNYDIDHKGFASNYLNDYPLYFASIENSNVSNDREKVLFIYDYNGDSCIIINTKPINTSNPNFFYYDQAVFNDTYIFTSEVTGSGSVFDYANVLSSNKNEINITKYDSQGNVIWQKFFGNDAAYFGLCIKPTVDSGCIMFATRYDKNINYFENDTYYIKLDKDGNQELNYLPVSTRDIFKSQLEGVVLYPNPAQHSIQFQYKNNEEIKLSIYSLDGKAVLKTKAHFNEAIPVHSLAPGNYAYRIISQQGAVASGLFTRE